MAKFAKGKHALAISDRSGQAFPWREMVTEWNGAFVHISEYERKQPQLEPKPFVADPQGLEQARPQHFNLLTGGGGGIIADLTLPGSYSFLDTSNNTMIPENPTDLNRRREASLSLGNVIAGVPAAATQTYAITVASGTLYLVGGTGNVFYLDGTRQMSLSIAKDTVIKFSQDNSSNDNHPLFITTSNSTTLSTLRSGIVSTNVSYYLDGASTESNYTNTTTFNAASERYLEWTPATTGTYYYACYIHGIGMGGMIQIT